MFNALPNDLPQLLESGRQFLIWDVNSEEIYLTVLDLPAGKSPEPDAFNAEFFKFFWPDIGDQVYDVVRYFFSNTTSFIVK